MMDLGTVQSAIMVTRHRCVGGPFDGQDIELSEFSRNSGVMDVTVRGMQWRGRYVLRKMTDMLYWRNA